ncbi:FAD binding domain-containing protein [Xylariomycetidae sp. FL2044]|nr:FAD binding domain-containing protein [Xylariomycetidae sp. FL2044]
MILTMSTRQRVGILSLFVVAAAIIARYMGDRAGQSICRTIPGDPDWPNQSEWDLFNDTVHGSLIATVPLPAPCHYSFTGGDGKNASVYDERVCDDLRNRWFSATTHLSSASSAMSYQFTNNTCNPFSDPYAACAIGYYVAYTVNATTTQHIQSALQFVQKHNIRLVIRNTGHDYLGKSSGAHALAIWTQHFKSIDLIEHYQDESSPYIGPAIRVSAGVEVIELYHFADAHGLMVVAGNCPDIGVTGGYVQGGGIGILSSKYGLAADQVLSFQVMTVSGEILIADSKHHEDLFWALRGGGGGTFGIVLSMVIKAYQDTFFSTASLTLLNDGHNGASIYSALGTFFQSLPSLVDAGAWIVWVAAPFGFMITPAMIPGVHVADLDALLQPTRDKMDRLELQYDYSSMEFPSFLPSYKSMGTTWNVSDYNMGGRLIPRELVETSTGTEALVGAIRYISSQTLMSGTTFNVSHSVSSPSEIATNPYFRKTIFSAAVGLPINYTDWKANRAEQDKMTRDLLPALQSLTPNGGVYLSEADFQAPDFQQTFYGDHYDRLLEVKKKYDPESIFYARTAVGSEDWEEHIDGKLCRK